MIFVFGSNLAGRHGKGAAWEAYNNHGAIYGQGAGRQGNSYAIPTKDVKLNALPLDAIQNNVQNFFAYADANPELQFNVTRIGCGLAGYKDEQIAPMFKTHPANCKLHVMWEKILKDL